MLFQFGRDCCINPNDSVPISVPDVDSVFGKPKSENDKQGPPLPKYH
jgi:hypothetical protein